eukprot:1939934-Pleurochrysis_carterae.AAC.1
MLGVVAQHDTVACRVQLGVVWRLEFPRFKSACLRIQLPQTHTHAHFSHALLRHVHMHFRAQLAAELGAVGNRRLRLVAGAVKREALDV